jgi:hypothetical protein
MIVEMCKHYGIEAVEQRPLQKHWRGKDGKITHEELASFTGIMGKTNQEGRDAALLAWVCAGLPIRLKTSLIKCTQKTAEQLSEAQFKEKRRSIKHSD